ncbi:phosphoesterase [Haloferula helveola]|uniref:Phosphoesterase n=1 Tax=Haloferula helveola TaxID=490095 RepID=A0ABM7RH60_9BACT|nr:phosphoesterase [Haloferula helveola]
MLIALSALKIELLPAAAAFLPDHGALVVSDLHLGKSATFRARGVPVPEGETAADLARLSDLLESTGARDLLITGDLVHAADGLNPEIVSQLRAWLESCPAKPKLIEGNHDRRAHLARHSLRLEITRNLEIDGVTLIHDPADLDVPGPAICGHLHPSVRLPDSPRRSLRIPCFHLSEEILALPGFGSFTGTHPIEIQPGDRVFVPLKDRIQELPVDRFP